MRTLLRALAWSARPTSSIRMAVKFELKKYDMQLMTVDLGKDEKLRL